MHPAQEEKGEHFQSRAVISILYSMLQRRDSPMTNFPGRVDAGGLFG